jgi:hypothetical protein
MLSYQSQCLAADNWPAGIKGLVAHQSKSCISEIQVKQNSYKISFQITFQVNSDKGASNLGMLHLHAS